MVIELEIKRLLSQGGYVKDSLDLKLWQNAGWLISPDLNSGSLDEFLEINCQYVTTFALNELITHKGEWLKNQLVGTLKRDLKNALELEDGDDPGFMTNRIRYYLGKIVDDESFLPPSVDSSSVTCRSCREENPNSYTLCWLCGKLLDTSKTGLSYANIFVEITSNSELSELIKFNYQGGPAEYQAEQWNNIEKNLFEELANLEDSEFNLAKLGNDDYLDTDSFEIFVRFSPNSVLH